MECSKEKIQQLKAAAKIEEIVGKDFVLKRVGKNYFTSCPFCGAQNKLSISSEKQFGHCFACGEHFDVFGYVQKVKGMNFAQAIIEIKKHINSRNDIEKKKLLKASAYFSELKRGKNPISNEPIRCNLFQIEQIVEAIAKMDWILVFLISDYSNLGQEKNLLPEEVAECEQAIQKILSWGFREESTDIQNRLTNLFKYTLELLELIKDNNFNLSGLVYGLKG